MTRKEKTMELASRKYAQDRTISPDYPIYNDEYELEMAFEAGVEWANKTMIEKACKWLRTEFEEFTRLHLSDEVIEKFKQAVQE